MADIQQWRRKIQPARVRTPAVEADDSDGIASPITPRRGIRPKLSSYFGQHGIVGNVVQQEPSFASLNAELIGSKLPSWPDNEPFPEPTAEVLIDSILCRLMSDPYYPLEVRFNGALLQIFERLRTLSDEKVQLLALLDKEVSTRKYTEQRTLQDQKHWAEERQAFQAEIKRLELFHITGERRLAEVTIGREDSVLCQRKEQEAEEAQDELETLFEFLEKTKRAEDKAWSSQRGKSHLVSLVPSTDLESSQIPNTSSVSFCADDTPVQAVCIQLVDD